MENKSHCIHVEKSLMDVPEGEQLKGHFLISSFFRREGAREMQVCERRRSTAARWIDRDVEAHEAHDSHTRAFFPHAAATPTRKWGLWSGRVAVRRAEYQKPEGLTNARPRQPSISCYIPFSRFALCAPLLVV
jgi:hypothetical protein